MSIKESLRKPQPGIRQRVNTARFRPARYLTATTGTNFRFCRPPMYHTFMMRSIRPKRFVLALCLMAAMFVGSASACTCSHHQEQVVSSDASCHSSHHGSTENVDTSAADNAFEVECVCAVNTSTPLTASKSEIKELKPEKGASSSDQAAPDHNLIATPVAVLARSHLGRELSYSNVLETLLPSRAPPRS